MADKSFKHPYLPDADGARTRSRDELDGTWSDTVRARLEGWSVVDGAWIKVAVDSTGTISTSGSTSAGGAVIQGAGGTSDAVTINACAGELIG